MQQLRVMIISLINLNMKDMRTNGHWPSHQGQRMTVIATLAERV